jgi:hypothetical protein
MGNENSNSKKETQVDYRTTPNENVVKAGICYFSAFTRFWISISLFSSSSFLTLPLFQNRLTICFSFIPRTWQEAIYGKYIPPLSSFSFIHGFDPFILM